MLEGFSSLEKTGKQEKDLSPAEREARIKERFSQSFSSRLAEYITGLRSSDPVMIDRLTKDKEIIRAKYGLPSIKLPPAEYERTLRSMAKELGVPIRPKAELERFFKEKVAGAIYRDETNEIYADVDRESRRAYMSSINNLEHELIHSIQQKRFPSMPIEAMEYEAYVAGGNMEYLRRHPDQIDSTLFNYFIGSSVNFYYREKSEKTGRKVEPIWNNPEYFLRKDGIVL
jgi:hypothetical protein